MSGSTMRQASPEQGAEENLQYSGVDRSDDNISGAFCEAIAALKATLSPLENFEEKVKQKADACDHVSSATAPHDFDFSGSKELISTTSPRESGFDSSASNKLITATSPHESDFDSSDGAEENLQYSGVDRSDGNTSGAFCEAIAALKASVEYTLENLKEKVKQQDACDHVSNATAPH